MSDRIDDDPLAITHESWCDQASHTDPAFECASKAKIVQGLSTHVTRAEGELCAFYAAQEMHPRRLAAAACFDLAARFTHLGDLLKR